MAESEEYDKYKDSNLRFFGYTNELGESFRPILPIWAVNATYLIAFFYASADTFDKATKAYNKESNTVLAKKKALDAGLYTITWQSLASLIVPPFFISRTMKLTRYILLKTTNFNTTQRRWACVTVGLLTIPIIFKPIDHAVHYTLENTYLPFAEKYICPKDS